MNIRVLGEVVVALPLHMQEREQVEHTFHSVSASHADSQDVAKQAEIHIRPLERREERSKEWWRPTTWVEVEEEDEVHVHVHVCRRTR